MNEIPKIRRLMLLQDTVSGAKYRVYACGQRDVLLYRTDTVYLYKTVWTGKSIIEGLLNKTLEEIPEETIAIDLDNLTPSERESFKNRCAFISEVEKVYGPTWEAYATKGVAKPELEALKIKYGVTDKQARCWINRYIQSGMQKFSLVKRNKMINGAKPHGEHLSSKKLGRPNEEGFAITGCPRDEYMLSTMKEAAEKYVDADLKLKSLKKLFLEYLGEYYNVYAVTGQGSDYEQYFPRPSQKQFRYEMNKILTPTQRTLLRMSARAARNNNRVFMGDTASNAFGPMDLWELDCWDSELYLVSSWDRKQEIGKAHLSLAVDVFMKTITAFSLAVDGDSWIGLSNLFMNITDDMVAFYKRYGLVYQSIPIIQGYLPNRVRTDNGGNYICDEFEDFLLINNITHETVPAGEGSLKPNVERAFGRIKEAIKSEFEHKGWYVDDPDSDHHKKACMTIEDFYTVVLNTIYAFNLMDNIDYPMERDMYSWVDPDTGEKFHPSQEMLWKYGVERFDPRPILNLNQYYMSLLSKGTGSLTRKGLEFKGMRYAIFNDSYLRELGMKTQDKVMHVSIYYDPRDLNVIWYRKANDPRLYSVGQMEVQNQLDFKHVSLAEWECLRKARGAMRSRSKAHNEKIEVALTKSNKTIISAHLQEDQSNEKVKPVTREAARQEKLRHQPENSVANHIRNNDDVIDIDVPEETKAVNPLIETSEDIAEINNTEETGSKAIPEDNPAKTEDEEEQEEVILDPMEAMKNYWRKKWQ